MKISFFDVFACNLSKTWAAKKYYTSNEWLKSLFFGRFLCNSRKLNVRGPRTSDVTVKFIESPFNIVEANGTDRCFRFRNGTPPVCEAEGQFGHLCRPCRREGRLAEAIFRSETPRARRLLLRREQQNLRMVHTLTTLEQQAVMSKTEAWRAAVAAKTSESDLLLERWHWDLEHQE